MVAVTVGEISPVPAGIIYCAVIETCHLAVDLHCAHEWTRALDRWCDAQQQLVAFSGQCQMHRAELYRLPARRHRPRTAGCSRTAVWVLRD